MSDNTPEQPATEEYERHKAATPWNAIDYRPHDTVIRADAMRDELLAALAAEKRRGDEAEEHAKQEIALVADERRKTKDESNRRKRDVRRLEHERDRALDRADEVKAALAKANAMLSEAVEGESVALAKLAAAEAALAELEAELDEALNIIVVEGLDAQLIEGIGWTIGKTNSLTIPAGAKDRLRKMLAEHGDE